MSLSSEDKIAVLGAGISGLATAWFLKREGFEVTIFEAKDSTGGVIKSEMSDHSVFDFGPNTIRDKSGKTSEMIRELDLEDQVLEISEAGKIRFVVRNGELQSIAPNPVKLLRSGALSLRGKMGLISEPFKKKNISPNDESIGDFLSRRIGKEAVEYLADPFFSGVYAGNIYAMSKHKLIKKISDFEADHGSIIRGFLKEKRSKSSAKPKILSFRKGVQQFTDRLSEKLSDSIQHEKVEALETSQEGLTLNTDGGEYLFDRVISCLPAYALQEILSDEFGKLKAGLSSVQYAPMLSTQLIYHESEVELPEKGFGFLVPRKENIRLLGAIWKSNIFPVQSESGFLHFNLMTGGAHDKSVLKEDASEVEQQVIKEFSKLMNIQKSPVSISSRLWEKAIPQFYVGFKEVDESIDQSEKEKKGLHIGGNYRWGVSLSDCVDGAFDLMSGITN